MGGRSGAGAWLLDAPLISRGCTRWRGPPFLSLLPGFLEYLLINGTGFLDLLSSRKEIHWVLLDTLISGLGYSSKWYLQVQALKWPILFFWNDHCSFTLLLAWRSLRHTSLKWTGCRPNVGLGFMLPADFIRLFDFGTWFSVPEPGPNQWTQKLQKEEDFFSPWMYKLFAYA